MTALLRCIVALFVAALLAGCAAQSPSVLSRSATATASPAVNEEYRLGVGDIISVRVYGADEDLRFERIRLSNPGMVTFPFGEFPALGRTTRDLESAITLALRGKILLNPRVWVNIDEYRPFFVQGQVARPGAYPYQPGLNVIKAVTIAGGFRERASLQKIFVVREGDRSSSPVKADLQTTVGPGDMVSIEESFF